MGSVKIVLRGRKNKDGLSTLGIRFIKERKTSYIFLNQTIDEKHWDAKEQRVKKSHPNSTRLNNFLRQKLAEANDKLLEMETAKPEVSVKKIRDGVVTKKSTSFFEVAKEYLENQKNRGKYNVFVAETPRINRFREFLHGSDITFNEITVPLLIKFQAYLRATRKISERTIINHLVAIRSVYSLAIKSGVADKRQYPFGKEKIKIKYPESVKIGLSQEEVIALETIDLSELPKHHHARNLWLFSFYLAGMRVSDVLRLKWDDIKDGRLHYTMGKNDKSGSFLLPDKAQAILSQYKNDTSNNAFVFPEMEIAENIDNAFDLQRRIAYRVKWLDKKLKDIQEMLQLDKKLTMHIARHTFGNLSGDKIPIQMLQKLYRHSSITTTIGYQSNFIYKDTDEALNAVIGF